MTLTAFPYYGPWISPIPNCDPVNWFTTGNALSPTFTPGNPGIVNAAGSGLPINSPVFFYGTTLPSELPVLGTVLGITYATAFVSATNWSIDHFCVSAAPGSAALAFDRAGSSDAFGQNDYLAAITTSASSSVSTLYQMRLKGGGAGAFKNVVGGVLKSGAGGEGSEWIGCLGGLPSNTTMFGVVGAAGHGAGPDAAPGTPGRGTDTYLLVPWNGTMLKIAFAQGGQIADSVGPGKGGNPLGAQSYWYPNGPVIAQSDWPSRSGQDGGPLGADGIAQGGGGGRVRGDGGGTPEGCGGSYNASWNDGTHGPGYSFEGMHGRIAIQVVQGPY